MSYFANANVTDIIQSIQLTGLYRGKTAKVYNVLGRRAGFTSTSALNDIKEFDNSVALSPTLTNAEPLEVVSSNANDTAAGTGARTVKITYIDSNYAIVTSDEITLNGTSNVALAFTAYEILWMEVITVGSGGVAAGNIRVRNSSDHTTEYEQVSAGGNRSLSSRFMVPDGYKGYLVSWDGHAVNTANQDMRLRALVNAHDRSLSTALHFQDLMYIAGDGQSSSSLAFLKCPARCRIRAATISSATPSTNRADVSFIIVIIAD